MNTRKLLLSVLLINGVNAQAFDFISVAECTARKQTFGLVQTRLDEAQGAIANVGGSISAMQAQNASLTTVKAELDERLKQLQGALAVALEKTANQSKAYAEIFQEPAAIAREVVRASETNLSVMSQRAQVLAAYSQRMSNLTSGVQAMQASYATCAPPASGLKRYWGAMKDMANGSPLARLEANYVHPDTDAGVTPQEFSAVLGDIDVGSLQSYLTALQPLTEGLNTAYRQMLTTHVATCKLAIQVNEIYLRYAPVGEKEELQQTVDFLKSAVTNYSQELGI